MPPKMGNVLPLFINVRKWASVHFMSLPVHFNFAQVKVKEECIIEWTSHLTKFLILLTQKGQCEDGTLEMVVIN